MDWEYDTIMSEKIGGKKWGESSFEKLTLEENGLEK